MAFSPIAHTIPEYDRNLYKNWWLKAYDQGTTTPLSMATDVSGGTLLAKAELDTQGFPVTSGGARFIPFINGDYDLWLFPTEADADSNDTTSAIQLADNLNADPLNALFNSDTVESIAALRLVTGISNQRIDVLSYYAPDFALANPYDGGGGSFAWDATSTETDDNGTVIKATGVDPGRWMRLIDGPIKAKWFGTLEDWDGSTGTDDATAFQAAITYCVDNDQDLQVIGKLLLLSSVDIDRVVDGAAFDKYFTIYSESGGGIVVNSAIAMFSSSIAFTTAPVTQLTQFKDISFESSNSALAAYVLDDARFLRTVFNNTTWVKIKCLSAATVHTQSIYFLGGQARRWTGDFFSSQGITFDLKVIGFLMEAGGDGFNLVFPVGCRISSTIEGMTNYAIKYKGGYGFTIDGCYFESNGTGVSGGASIDGTGSTGSFGNEAVLISGNMFSGEAADPTKPQVLWGDGTVGRSIGNQCTTTLHQFTTNSRVTYDGDHARVALSSNDVPVINATSDVWTLTTAYSLADRVRPTTPNVNGFHYEVSTAGTTAGSEPTWPATLGDTVVDGTVTWLCVRATLLDDIRSHTHIGQVYRTEPQYLYGGIVKSEFVGGFGGYLRLRTLQNGVESTVGIDIDEAGNTEIGGYHSNTGTPQTLTGPGAMSAVIAITWIVTTGADALTLPDGKEGQHKYIVMKTDGGDGTLTPANLGNGTTITFDDVGDSAYLMFTNAAWHFMGGTATLT